MKALYLSRRLKDGTISDDELRFVEEKINNADDEYVGAFVYNYIKYIESVDVGGILKYIDTTKNPYILSDVIGALSIRGVDDAKFEAKIIEFARGVHWDDGYILRSTAITSLPLVVKDRDKYRDILKDAYNSGIGVVKNAAIVAAQKYIGIPSPKVVWPDDDDVDLSNCIPPSVIEWIEK